MKTIFITVGESSVARNVLRTGFWTELTKEPLRIVLLVKKAEEQYYKEKFAGENIVIEGLTGHRVGALEKVLAFFSMHAFRSGTKEVIERREYALRKTGVPPYIKKIFGIVFANAPGIKQLIRRLELRIAPNDDLAAVFETYKPSAVFCTVIVNTDVDINVARETKRRRVRLVAMTRSWDNLTSYGFLRVKPDVFIAQNEFLKEMAIRRHELKEETIVVSGIPHYDQYIDKQWIIDRSEFFGKLNLDPAKKYILYGAVGDFLFPSEGMLAPVMEEIGTELDLQFVFRAHPAFKSPLEKLKGLTHVFPDRNAVYLSEEEGSWQMEESHIRHLINSLYHADVVLTSGSSFLIDAPAFHKPTVTIAFDGKEASYWNSVARFYDRFDHIVDLLKTNGVRVANTKQQLMEEIRAYLANPEKDRAGRGAIIKRFVAPYDGQSSHRLFEIIQRNIA